MKKLNCLMLAILFAVLTVGTAFAEKFGTPEEAEALVKKAVAYVKANGKEKAIVQFNNPSGPFRNKDLYITAYEPDGMCRAHFNPKLVGKNLVELRDKDGKFFIKERLEIASTKGHGWQDYRYVNPVTKEVEPKAVYVEKAGDMIIACGAYKK